MSWVFSRPSLTLIEIGWRWLFGLPLLAVCWIETRRILAALPPESTGLSAIDPQNPWVAVVQLTDAWALYRPLVGTILRWLLPVAALAWVVASGVGRNLLLQRLTEDPARRVAFRPLEMVGLQAAWLGLLGATGWGWYRAIQWVADTHISNASEPDLVGYAVWMIFLSLGFFALWALISWSLTVAPLLMLLEERSAASALRQSLSLGKAFSSKLVETNLVMGIVKLALVVLAMVLSAAPLPFSDELGPGAMNAVLAVATLFYLVAGDFFQVVRLKGFVEFWKMYRGQVVPTVCVIAQN
jgi:hypothetical protein